MLARLRNIWDTHNYLTVENIGFVFILLVLFGAPLVVDTHLISPIATPKALFIELVGLTLLLLVFLRTFVADQVTIRLSYLSGAVLVFVFVLTLSAVLGVDPLHSFFGTIAFDWAVSVHLYYAAAVIALVFPLFVSTPVRLRYTLRAVFWGTVLLAITTYVDIYSNVTYGFFHATLAGGTMGNTSLAGGYLLFGIFLGVYLVFTASFAWRKIVYGLCTIGIFFSPVFINVQKIYAMAVSVSVTPAKLSHIVDAQGAFLGLVAGLAVTLGLVLMSRSHTKLHVAGQALLIVIAAVVMLAGISFFSTGGYLHEKYAEIKTPNRFIFWDIALEGMHDRPLLGWGFGNYQYMYDRHFNPVILEPGHISDVWVAEPHNVFLSYVAETGILGLISYLILYALLVMAFLRLATRSDKRLCMLAYIVPGLLTAVFMQNLFIFDSPASVLGFFFLIGVALALSEGTVMEYTYRPKIKFVQGLTEVGVLSLVGTLLCMAGIIFFVAYPYVASYQLDRIVGTSNLQVRGAYWWSFMQLPYRGNLIDAGFIADGIYNQSLLSVPDIGTDEERRKAVVGELDNILAYVEDREARSATRSYRSAYFAVKLLNLRNYLEPDPHADFRARVDGHLADVFATSPSNPKSYFVAAQVDVDRGHYTDAANHLSIGFRLAPHNPKAIELIGIFLTVHEDDRLLQFYQQFTAEATSTQGE